MKLDISFAGLHECDGLVLHMPPFLHGVEIEADGEKIKPAKAGWIISGHCRQIKASWLNNELPDISYAEVVKKYMTDYKDRFLNFNER